MALKGINRKSDESKQHRITEKLSRMNIANFHEQLSDTANHFWSKFQTKNRIIQNSCKWITKIMSINRNLLIFERFVYFNYKIYALLLRVGFACIFVSFVINIAQCKSNNNQRDAQTSALCLGISCWVSVCVCVFDFRISVDILPVRSIHDNAIVVGK